MENTTPEKCPRCGEAVPTNAFFCPNCGKQLKPRPESTSIGKQIVVYLVSLFLAPFGLIFAWKYLKQPGKASKYIGIVAIVLTLISIGITVWTAVGFLEYTYKDLRTINELIY